MSKWRSNDKRVIEAIPDTERASSLVNLDLNGDQLPAAGTLGVRWNMETDEF